jgi:chromosome partitioning protein
MRIITVTNQKGGVGKTTTSINLAAGLARAGKRVMLVDLDPQGNATSGLGVARNQIQTSLYELIFDNSKAQQAVMTTNVENLYLLACTPDLAAAEVELASKSEREYFLKKLLSIYDTDIIVIDSPPALGLLTINALVAADNVLIPVQAEYYALEGLGQLVQTIQRVRAGLNPGLTILGVLLTMYDSRTSLSRQVEDELKKHFKSNVFSTVIPRSVRLAEAPSFGKVIFDHDKWSKGARAYKALSKEVLKRLG